MSDEACPISGEDVALTVKKHLGIEKPNIINYTITAASEDSLGFMGEHVRIKVQVLTGDKEQEFQYFAKKIPTQAKSHMEYAEKTKAFYKEIELYKTLFSDMHEALSPERCPLPWRPQCYFTRDWDLLIAEDLSLKGYYMLPERSFMDLEHFKASLQAMARMHSGAIIFEEKLNAGKCSTQSAHFTPGSVNVTIRDLYPNLIFETECIDKPGHPGFSFWEVGIKSQVALVDLLPGYSAEQKEKIKLAFPDTIRQVYRMIEPSEKFRNVMIHADLWGNNLLFRAGPDGKLSNAITVDYQMTRYAPPAQDLFMLFHIVQTKSFRDTYEAELTDLFYTFLANELTAEGLDINKLLPRQEFDESCTYYKRYAVLNQMIYTQLNIVPPHIAGKFMSTTEDFNRVMHEDRADILIESFETDDLCRERIIEAMDEIIEMFGLA